MRLAWWGERVPRPHPVLPVLAAALTLAVAVQVRRVVAATTMEDEHAAYWRRRGRSPGTFLLVALGDSLAQGLGAMRAHDSWAGRLADHLERTRDERVRVVVLGVGGATVGDVARDQLPLVPPAALRGEPATLVALCVGTNDVTSTRPADYRRTLDAVCAALPDGSLVTDLPDFQRGPDRPAGARLAAVAREVVDGWPGLRLVRLEDATRRLRPWELGPDLAHPSGLGYRRFGAAFAAALADPPRPPR